jgi:hypothetical protein
MSVAWVQSTTSFTGTGTATATATYATTPTAGNLLTVALWSFSMEVTASFTTPTDTAANTYILAIEFTDSSSNTDGSGALYFAWKCLTQASNIVTESVPGQTIDFLCVSEYSGVQNSSNPIGPTNSVTVVSGATTQVTLTGVEAGSLIIAVAHQDGTLMTAATPAGATIRFIDSTIDHVCYLDYVSAAGGSVTVGVTPPDGANGNIAAAAFVPANNYTNVIFYSMDF